MGDGLSGLVTLNCGNLGPAAQSLQIRSGRKAGPKGAQNGFESSLAACFRSRLRASWFDRPAREPRSCRNGGGSQPRRRPSLANALSEQSGGGQDIQDRQSRTGLPEYCEGGADIRRRLRRGCADGRLQSRRVLQLDQRVLGFAGRRSVVWLRGVPDDR